MNPAAVKGFVLHGLVPVFFSMFMPLAIGRDWYVDLNDSNCANGTGGQTDPFCNVTDAIAAASAGDRIFIAPGSYNEILSIDKDLTLIGPAGRDAVGVDTLWTGRTLTIAPGVWVEVTGVSLSGGQVTDSDGSEGGAVLVDTDATLILFSSRVSDSRATGGDRATGGGVHNRGTLIAEDTDFERNQASCTNLWSESSGGAIHNELGSVLLLGCTITDNSSQAHYFSLGGGIYSDGGSLELTECFVDSNMTEAEDTARGGGLYTQTRGVNASVTLKNTTVSQNTAQAVAYDSYLFGEGGGIFNYGCTLTIDSSLLEKNIAHGQSTIGVDYPSGFASGGGLFDRGITTLTNSTVRANSCRARGRTGVAHGGGIVSYYSLTLRDSTISINIADGGNGYNGSHAKGGGIRIERGMAHLTNVTVAQNVNRARITEGGGLSSHQNATGEMGHVIVADNRSVDGPDAHGTFTSLGYNLFSDSTNLTLTGDLTGNLLDVDPLIGVLGDNGGPTPTHLLLPGSPAIDAGDPAASNDTDQRGTPRPQDGDGSGVAVRDMGSVEVALARWSNYGTGWPGTLGVPSFTSSANPTLGSSISLDVGNSLGSSTIGLLFVGLSAASIPTSAGGTLLVLPSTTLPILVPAIGLSLSLDVADPLFPGLVLYLQVLEHDPGASRDLSFTEGLRLQIGDY